MRKPFIDYPLITRRPFRQVMAEQVYTPGGALPVSGGWGYTLEDAIIIDKNDPVVSRAERFDGVSLEHYIVALRLFAELVFWRNEGEYFAGIQRELLEQRILQEGGRYYDHLRFVVTACLSHELDALYRELKLDRPNPEIDMREYSRRRSELLWSYHTDYWFDITGFYGQ